MITGCNTGSESDSALSAIGWITLDAAAERRTAQP
jgi:hypothetical protein